MSRYDDLTSNLGIHPILCSNLGFGEQGAILSKMQKAIYICSDIDKAKQMQQQLKSLNKECVLIDDFDKPFTLSKFSSQDNKRDILNATFKLTTSTPIIISTPQILFTLTTSLNDFKSKIVDLKKGQEFDLIELEKILINIGYKKTEALTSPGEFTRRGDVLDVFNSVDTNPLRLDFFDTTLENIYYFDRVTREKLETKTDISLSPNKLFFYDKTDELLSKINEFKINDNSFFDIYNLIERNEDVPLEFLYPFCENIIQFAELDIPIVISNFIQFKTIHNKLYDNLIEKINLVFKDEKLAEIFIKSKKINKNNRKYLKIDAFFDNFNKKLIFFDNLSLEDTDLKNYLNEPFYIDFNTKRFSNYFNNLDLLKNELSIIKNKQIYLCLKSDDTFNSIKKIFVEKNIPFSTNSNSFGIILTKLDIPYNICFDNDEKFYIGSTNFAHKKQVISTSKKAIKYLPKAGEYVVHSTHGIGLCEGIVTVNVSGVDKEFFKLTYQKGDSLYVPVENADCLSLYMADGGQVRLNKLGGKEFFNEKVKALKSIEDMSGELLELYAKRKAVKGFKYQEDDYLYTEFENAFPYTETADQLLAISDIKNDMHSGKVMDRLICGDVGFGKTEVAMRGMFKAVENGKQVAILAPTTILSLQHFMSASKRTKDFGVRVEMLNRFKSAKEQKQIIEDLKAGKINVICGTHRLLSKDVEFKDLGLLILDEEQRFGVKAKEQIKQIKNNVNVLSLSATPIPRTLSMTLMNIRDISIINTPPVDRLPVKTYVLSFNKDIILNAINEEVNRGGQVLIVCNNIEKLYHIADEFKKDLTNPKAVFDVAHGQMSEIALENAVKRLYDKTTNVFVSTTLIENGIDLPLANTLIIIDSDHLGLSQMYQLRGRVGRSSEQAYAYFTYEKGKVLTEESASRLQALAENTELGSGFKIAMRDLQIRGAGELLGKVQHGHMVRIGYDMYTKLLNETLKKLKGEKVEVEKEVKLDIAIPSKIPTSFISDESERLKIIAKISNIVDKNSAREILNDLLSTYGKLPKEIYELCNITLLKSLAIKNNIKQITITKTRMAIVYYENCDLSKLMKSVTHTHFKFEKGALPTITLDVKEFSVLTALNYMIEFLIKQ